MELTVRQKKIIDIIKNNQPITGKQIADLLSLSRSALRTDFSILIGKGYISSKTNVGYIYTKKEITNKNFIKDIMKEAPYVLPNTSVYNTILEIFSKDVGTIFVAENDILLGVVSRKDLLKIAIGNNDIYSLPINVIMTRVPNIIYALPDDTIKSAVTKLINHQVDALPIVEPQENNSKLKLIGKITKTTITNIFLDFFNEF